MSGQFVELGTPLSSASQNEQFVPVWKQEVRDKQGRKRLHGAFEGGFSAGYFNTVGSKEGWSPAKFKSSKTKRTRMEASKPMDYMDEEDIQELENSIDLEARSFDSDLTGSAVNFNKEIGLKIYRRLKSSASNKSQKQDTAQFSTIQPSSSFCGLGLPDSNTRSNVHRTREKSGQTYFEKMKAYTDEKDDDPYEIGPGIPSTLRNIKAVKEFKSKSDLEKKPAQSIYVFQSKKNRDRKGQSSGPSNLPLHFAGYEKPVRFDSAQLGNTFSLPLVPANIDLTYEGSHSNDALVTKPAQPLSPPKLQRTPAPASIKQPAQDEMQRRFVKSSEGGQQSQDAAPSHIQSVGDSAFVRGKSPGKITRIELPFLPSRLLCRRFGVPFPTNANEVSSQAQPARGKELLSDVDLQQMAGPLYAPQTITADERRYNERLDANRADPKLFDSIFGANT